MCELLVPYDEGGRLAELHELAGDLEREDTPEGSASLSGCRPRWRPAIAPFARYADPAGSR